MVGAVNKANISELEEEVRSGFTRRVRKKLTGVVQGISGKKMLLVIFQDGCENYLTSNQLTKVIVEKSLVEEEPGVPTNPEILGELVTSHKGYYHGVYVILHFNKEVGFYSKEEQEDVKMILMRKICKM